MIHYKVEAFVLLVAYIRDRVHELIAGELFADVIGEEFGEVVEFCGAEFMTHILRSLITILPQSQFHGVKSPLEGVED